MKPRNIRSPQLTTSQTILKLLILQVLVFHVSIVADEIKISPSGEQQQQQQQPSPKQQKQHHQHHHAEQQIRLPILDTLFPQKILDDAWEKHPLFVTPHTHQPFPQTSNPIPTHLIPNITTTTTTTNPPPRHPHTIASQLISFNDLDEIFRHPLVHSRDFSVVKKVFIDGEEWTGVLPTQPSVDQAIHEVFVRGKSLILNAMQKRWGPIAKVARLLESETGTGYVSCNLYLTPEVVAVPPSSPTGSAAPADDDRSWRSGFEAHLDWMDVVVIQIAGEKMWSVAREALLYLPTEDMKRKPTREEMRNYVDDNGRFEEFLMRPGDVLFIPRGFVHNASTMVLGGDGDEEEVKTRGNSLHLTFGLEHSCHGTMEQMIHYALNVWLRRPATAATRVVVERERCRDVNGGTNRGIIWWQVMHYAVAEVARRDDVCYSEDSRSSVATTTMTTCRLRRVVPLHAIWRPTCDDNDDDDTSRCIRDDYRRALDIIKQYANWNKATSLLSKMAQSQSMICFPGASLADKVVCDYEGVETAASSAGMFASVVEEFYNFAMENFEVVLKEMEDGLVTKRMENWRDIDASLDKVGHTVFSGKLV